MEVNGIGMFKFVALIIYQLYLNYTNSFMSDNSEAKNIWATNFKTVAYYKKINILLWLTSFIFLLNIDDTIHLLHECWRHIKIHLFKKKNLLKASPKKNLNFWEKSNILFFLDQFKTRRVLIGFPTKKAKTLRVFDLLC